MGFESAPYCNQETESHALTAQPPNLKNQQKLATNKAATHAKSCQCNSAKVAPNTNRLILAGKNLEYNKLKAFTLTLHVTNRKA